MPPFNAAYRQTLLAGRLTLGLMTPVARANGAMADPEAERDIAALADRLGFAALWTRDVPVMVPQGDEISVLDEPFAWLTMLAGATRRIALGTAAAVLPLRHPLHVAKSALSVNRLSGERFIFGLGSGDREAEFAIFRQDIALRGDAFRERWSLVRSALSPDAAGRAALREATGGHDLMAPPAERIGMLVVGSARQSLQWTAAHADGWATYHRDEARQQGRIGLWQTALRERAGSEAKPFIQSLQIDLLENPAAPAEPIELGLRTGRDALVAYLDRMEDAGVAHVLMNVVRGPRPAAEVVDELGREVLPRLQGHARTPAA
ncbi:MULTISPECIES: TIGR03571 family LLM class oxidoreductase [Variovorax]|jgi:luciferase-type oxidoreductase|uniref:TIGR03571 family LLM class oxidoreductase n=1 Tax=Variovorax TaxID=34072 RepID=UPI00086C86F4|nr:MULTISPECIES: TIGR03571 family LLM class oxidoreductase [Variovorax]MBN8757626.1 TIGR03571 family LLM class oxidoreductase [Variovorax sp.]ODU13234.1 MAG: LLM class oxidoreductase [Variovorax sp. SCN 67-85]ODV22032.1 MAG: LLM class oxidoreductase [Variovorax sp. SCN 67-20]OJZ07745.1 MAG: LLM class oxidoreductase [Variovorax sp. 67-131]UKI10593.1 TIGR03571 family LLM class oxidoreductase [Variovorax paradoxus]